MDMTTRVLFVEDVPADAELAEREMRKSGMRFDSVRVDAEETYLAALSGFKPDLVISDYAMPGFDGRRVLATLRVLGCRRYVHNRYGIVAMS